MTARKGKRPTIWVLVCTDVDSKQYAFEWANTRRCAMSARRIWMANERCRRRYEVVMYAPVVRKGGRRK
jgi:hypothetical protein